MAEQYKSKYTGPEIDAALGKANTAIQPEEGKGLSSNDYTDEEKNKLASLTGGSSGVTKDYELYCYKKCIIDSNPFTRIHYAEDNLNYKPAGMNYRLNRFDYGSWRDAFFMKVKPCMLKSNGEVDYYLNPDDYSKKEDGSDSDVANVSYNGNAMIEFPLIYTKRETIGLWSYVYVCNKKLDDSYKAYSNTDQNGNLIDHFYVRIYEGSIQNSILRSLSGLVITGNKTISEEVAAAQANGTDWYTGVWADRTLINDLLILISKNTNTQESFGYGLYSGITNASSLKKTGLMDTKGLFWGDKTNSVGVKIFGIENWWGNAWERIAGYMYIDGKIKVKLTWDKTDGSSINGYNTTGNGYIEIPDSTISGTSGSCITESYTTEFGEFPKKLGGSETTYDTDGYWYNNGGYAIVGSNGNTHNFLTGALCISMYIADLAWSVVSSISCKPQKK